jgi:hypothetical protein
MQSVNLISKGDIMKFPNMLFFHKRSFLDIVGKIVLLVNVIERGRVLVANEILVHMVIFVEIYKMVKLNKV